MKSSVVIGLAELQDAEAVCNLVVRTIQQIYPLYYPALIVEWFTDWHSQERISADIEAGKVFAATIDGEPVGTITIDGEHITRLFVDPDRQGEGIGTALLDFAETKVAKTHDKVCMDSSLAAANLYDHRGYRTISHDSLTIENKDGNVAAILVWELVEKPLTANQ